MELLRLNSSSADFDDALNKLLFWDMTQDSLIDTTVGQVIATVRQQGDAAVLRYTREFDSLDVSTLSELTLSPGDLASAWQRISAVEQNALANAYERILAFHEHQRESSWSFTDDLDNELGQKITPLKRVGVYVPGGQASYPSTVLMTLGPASVAGVEEIVVTVPTPHGERNDMVLAALHLAGVQEVYTIGGAQAIAALAHGTATITRVDKIVGPGGAYVASAKRQVFGQVGIDVIAGPSEVLVIADGSTDPEWTALDLFSQAEHDAAAQAILLSPDRKFLTEVAAVMDALLPTMRRQEIIAASLRDRGALIQTRDLDDAAHIANRVAPEHLELHVENPQQLVEQIRNAGAIFCGAYTGETLGDYVAGPSHVLPTFGTARFASPLGVYDFVKRSSVITMSPQGAAQLADIAVPLATAEGLHAHALAASVRAARLNSDPSGKK